MNTKEEPRGDAQVTKGRNIEQTKSIQKRKGRDQMQQKMVPDQGSKRIGRGKNKNKPMNNRYDPMQSKEAEPETKKIWNRKV